MTELRLEDSVVDERYRLQRCLSRGSYAEIFLATDPERDGLQVIIKALNPFLQGTPDPLLEQTLVENFQNEAIALDKVRHPNIIRRLGHGTASDLEGTPFHYLVLEYMAGGDMLSLCRAHPIALADTLLYFGQVSEGLYFAHCQNVIHRDIKPNNLLLSGDHRTVKIADFGVAKIAPDESDEITKVGTNIYAPPEHHPDVDTSTLNQPLTPSADIYSLAKTIYTAVSGRAPHQFARRPITALPENIASEPWAVALLPILEKATASQASQRYQSAPEFWAAVQPLRSYVADGAEPAEPDSEATIVRGRGAAPVRFGVELGRVSSGMDHLSRAPRPNFQPVRRSTGEHPVGKLDEAKIVVAIPEKEKPVAEFAKAAPTEAVTVQSQEPDYTQGAPSDPGASFKTRALTSSAAVSVIRPPGVQSESPAIRSLKSQGVMPPPDYSFIASLRNTKWIEWFRRAFILFLVLFLISLVAKVYLYFAASPIQPPSLRTILGLGVAYEDGSISGAPNVNLRVEPSGSSLAWLPSGSRVRVLETRGSWVRVKVLQWAGSPPTDAPDGGWMDRRYLKIDGK